MTSKSKAADKRTRLPRSADFTRAFRKDWHRLSRSGRHDMRRLKQAMLLLIANSGPMPPEWRDHALKGEWSGSRECHIRGDFLLIYQASDTAIVFVRTGTHSDLFQE